MCICGTCVKWASTKRKIIFFVVSVCQVTSCQVCLYSPISYSVSQWALQAHNSKGSEPRLSKKTRKNLPQKCYHIKNGTNFERKFKKRIYLLSYHIYVSGRKLQMYVKLIYYLSVSMLRLYYCVKQLVQSSLKVAQACVTDHDISNHQV